MTLRIFPATELHLLANTQVDLRFFAKVAGVFTDLSTRAGFNAAVESETPGGVVAVTSLATGARVAASATGASIVRLELADGAPAVSFVRTPIRATVHAKLARLLVPRPSLALETGRGDRVLTVYGEFDDAGVLTIGDVTRHPYLRYAVAVVSGAPTVNVVDGRVTTGAGTGTARVTISVDPALGLAVPTTSIDLDVAAPPAERPILRRVHAGTAVRTRAIVVLAEGFTTTEQKVFDDLVDDITRTLIKISPISHVRESLEIYAAFVSSAESGISIGPPILPSGEAPEVGYSLLPDQPFASNTVGVIEMVFGATNIPGLGLPGDPGAPATPAAAATAMHIPAAAVPAAVFHAWQQIPNARTSRVRETAFGTMLAGRHGGSRAQQHPANATTRVDLDVLRDPGDDENTRTPIFDERRLPDLAVAGADPANAHAAQLDAFLRTLRAPDGPAGFGARWTTGQPDAGLVVLLINADHYGGVRLDSCIALPIGGGIMHRVQASTVVPGLVEVVPIPRPIAFWSAEHILGFRERPIGSLADRVAHELGHSAAFGNLGDEYGGGRDPTDPAFVPFVESAPNTQMLAAVAGPGGAHVDAARLKWNLWPRAEGAAVPEQMTGTGQRLVVTLNAEDWLRWPQLAAGRTVLLRGRNLATNLPAPVALTFQTSDSSTQRLEFDVPAGDTVASLRARFPVDPVTLVVPATLVVPRLDGAGHPVPLVDPAVAAELLATGPFGASGPHCALNTAPAAPFIVGIRFWRLPRLIGAYESAAEANCQVVRPTLDCKMRTVVDMFESPVGYCHVCKYVIVDSIDPGAHADVDREYPT